MSKRLDKLGENRLTTRIRDLQSSINQRKTLQFMGGDSLTLHLVLYSTNTWDYTFSSVNATPHFIEVQFAPSDGNTSDGNVNNIFAYNVDYHWDSGNPPSVDTWRIVRGVSNTTPRFVIALFGDNTSPTINLSFKVYVKATAAGSLQLVVT